MNATNTKPPCPTPECAAPHVVRNGTLKGRQRYHCRGCGAWGSARPTARRCTGCARLSELRRELRKAKERLRHKKHVILGCIRQLGFEV